MATTRTVKSIKTTSIASEAYKADGVAPTLDVLESASIWSYLVSGTKLTIISAWSVIAGFVGALAYIKEMSKQQD
jgi:hypothetical protein